MEPLSMGGNPLNGQVWPYCLASNQLIRAWERRRRRRIGRGGGGGYREEEVVRKGKFTHSLVLCQVIVVGPYMDSSTKQ